MKKIVLFSLFGVCLFSNTASADFVRKTTWSALIEDAATITQERLDYYSGSLAGHPYYIIKGGDVASGTSIKNTYYLYYDKDGDGVAPEGVEVYNAPLTDEQCEAKYTTGFNNSGYGRLSSSTGIGDDGTGSADFGACSVSMTDQQCNHQGTEWAWCYGKLESSSTGQPNEYSIEDVFAVGEPDESVPTDVPSGFSPTDDPDSCEKGAVTYEGASYCYVPGETEDGGVSGGDGGDDGEDSGSGDTGGDGSDGGGSGSGDGSGDATDEDGSDTGSGSGGIGGGSGGGSGGSEDEGSGSGKWGSGTGYDGFGDEGLDAKLAEAKENYLAAINEVRGKAEDMFESSLNVSGSCEAINVEFYGNKVDIAPCKYLVTAAPYIRPAIWLLCVLIAAFILFGRSK